MTTKTQTTEKRQDFNSSINQDIKGRFVGQHVYCNVNSLVEYCIGKEFEDKDCPVNLDDIENYYTLDRENINSNILSDWDEKEEDFTTYANDPDTYNRRVKTKGDFEVFLNSLDEDDFNTLCDDFSYDCETEPQEIYEWWAVSSYLYDKLKAEGHPVVDAGSCYIWGRPTTGQAILLDGVISRICSGMEILDGQSNSWAKSK